MMKLIELKNVSVDFPIFGVNSRSFKKSIINVGSKFITRGQKKSHTIVRALNNISLKIEDGDRIGLIGPNGAGKSTLLKVLSRIYEPTMGTVTTHGKIMPLLDMQLGMNDELSGVENIYLRGLILGYSKKQIKQKIEDISEFSELGNYLTMPIKVYSAGMRLRLAFSIATAFISEILLIDESVLAGDRHFIEKANVRIENFVNNSNIFIIASHSDEIIKNFCNKVILLRSGTIEYLGNVEKALEIYNGEPVA